MKDQCMFIFFYANLTGLLRFLPSGLLQGILSSFYVTVSQQTSLGNKEDECQHLRTMCETSQKNLEELAEKHQEHLQELANLHEKLQVRSFTHFLFVCKTNIVKGLFVSYF